jgi:hypothetical protein
MHKLKQIKEGSFSNAFEKENLILIKGLVE